MLKYKPHSVIHSTFTGTHVTPICDACNKSKCIFTCSTFHSTQVYFGVLWLSIINRLQFYFNTSLDLHTFLLYFCIEINTNDFSLMISFMFVSFGFESLSFQVFKTNQLKEQVITLRIQTFKCLFSIYSVYILHFEIWGPGQNTKQNVHYDFLLWFIYN
jgi:hypothetical protein